MGTGSATGGTITGRVTDQSGAVVPGATVTVTDVATKISKTSTSNKEGLFVFVDMGPAVYDVGVVKEGFKHFAMVGQELIVGQALTLNASP